MWPWKKKTLVVRIDRAVYDTFMKHTNNPSGDVEEMIAEWALRKGWTWHPLGPLTDEEREEYQKRIASGWGIWG